MVENKLKEGWRKVKLSEVVDFNPENLKKNNNLEFINYLDTANITEGRIDEIKKIYPNEEKIPSRAKRIVQINDVIYSSVRPNLRHYGILKNFEKNLIVSTGFIVLRAKNLKISPDYLYNFLRLKKNIEFVSGIAETSTTTYPSITSTVLADLQIELPPLKTQEKIASILSALDDKIEINNEMNKTLEEMAQTLFKRWFIDFDFPNENEEPYKSSGGKMVDSELGEIPEGWEVNKLGNLFKFIKGKKPKIVSEICSEETPLKYLTIKGFNGDENLYASEDKTILIDKKDIVMVMDGASSGDVYIGKSGVLGSTFSKIEKIKEINWSYIYLILKYYENDIKSHTTGSAIPHTDKGYVEKIKISLPNLELLNFLSAELSGLIKRKLINQQEIQSLTEIRDILLPKLMSGEIEV